MVNLILVEFIHHFFVVLPYVHLKKVIHGISKQLFQVNKNIPIDSMVSEMAP